MGGAVEVVELSPALEAGYAGFMTRQPAFMIYGTLEFKAFLQRVVNGTPRYLVARQAETVVGALPLFSTSHDRWGTVLNSLPWYGSHGGCLVDPGGPAGVREALLAHYRRLLQPETLFATMIPAPDETGELPVYREALAPTTEDERIGQVTPLPEAGPGLEQRLERVCHQKTRNLIRKSLKQGFQFELSDSDDSWRFIIDTHAENMAAIGGLAKPASHFHALRQTIPASWRQIALASLDGRPVAAVLLLRFNRTVEYLTPVIKQEYRPMQPLSFAIWHAMIDAVGAGYRWWNWGGTWTSQLSLHHFKQGWGAEDRPYRYLIHASSAGVQALHEHRQELSDAFPNYFLYPFAQLNR